MKISNMAMSSKVSAKLKHLLSFEDINKIVSMKKVSEVINYLKNLTDYGKYLKGIDETVIHRGKFEIMLRDVLYEEAESLKNFADEGMKKQLNLFLLRDEIEAVKLHVRSICTRKSLMLKKNYDYKINRFPNIKFLSNENEEINLENFINSTKGTFYYKVLSPILQDEKKQNLFVIETAIENYYSRLCQLQAQKLRNKRDKDVLNKIMGIEIDLSNVMFIIRAKVYYRMNQEEIYPHIFGHYYKTNKNVMTHIVGANTLEEIILVLKKTVYKKAIIETDDVVAFEEALLMYQKNVIKNFLIKRDCENAISLIYLKFKKIEIDNIITIVESIRYGVPPNEILKSLSFWSKK